MVPIKLYQPQVAVIIILMLIYLLKIKKIRNTDKNIFLNLEIEKIKN